ncbi:MAG: DUF2752 domain-containing protein [Planctomycetales bacterium]|nr:DUF2752 domain-containing protein [Planctomycetales bacterium]
MIAIRQLINLIHFLRSVKIWLTALSTLALFLIASLLQPNASGSGTHIQLGLPVCMWKTSWGIACPVCGMTTSWSHFVRGQFASSISANPAGFLLAIIALACVTTCCYLIISGHKQIPRWTEACFATALFAFVLVATWHWLRQF